MADGARGFGAAAIAPAVKGPQQHADARLHDCGKHGRLTVAQIARLVGVTRNAIYHRIELGMRGEELLLPKDATRARAMSRASMRTAFRLTRAFPDRVPSIAEIRKVVPMQKTNAYRWRAVIRNALDGSR